jgi:serine/threonine-protein kinase
MRWRPPGLPELGRGAALAGGVTVAAFLLLLYPGLRTPRSSGEAGRQAIAAAASRSVAGETRASDDRRGTGDPQRDKGLSELVTSLDPALKQTLADSLAIYRSSARQELPPPRALVGSDLAPVRITEFTDILCEHCASLHQTLRTLRESVPPGSYSVDARQFPLDGRCNPLMEPYKADDVRCVSAKLRIAAEPLGKEPDLAAALFEKQQGLTHDKALQIASRFLTKDQIQVALSSPAVQATLEQDISTAARFDSDGTPIVAINGRKATSFGPFLYAMVLTRGNADHPAFDALPPGNPAAHLH